jgi:predicted DNA-binding antitoxin AbrB/MazE fold protein
MITAKATYENGVLKLDEPIALEEHARVTVAIAEAADSAPPVPPATAEELRQALPDDFFLKDVIGIGEGPENGDGAAEHDHYLYGFPKKKK